MSDVEILSKKIKITKEENNSISIILNYLKKSIDQDIENVSDKYLLENKSKYLSLNKAGENTVKWLKNQVIKISDEIRKDFNKLIIKNETLIERTFRRNGFSPIKNFEIQAQYIDIKFLDYHLLNQYYFSYSFENDCNICKEKISLLYDKYSIDFISYCDNRKKDISSFLDNEINKRENIVKKFEVEIEKILLNKKDHLLEFENQKLEVRESIKRWILDRERFNRLDYFLKRAYLIEVENIKKKINSTNVSIQENGFIINFGT